MSTFRTCYYYTLTLDISKQIGTDVHLFKNK